MLRGKLVQAIICCFLLSCVSGNAVCHPPKEVSVEFDFDTKVLKVEAQHRVKNEKKHYVDMAQIELNGKQVISQEMFSQGDIYGLDLQYKMIDLKEGDKLLVKLKCNRFGTIKEKVVIKKVFQGIDKKGKENRGKP